MPRETVLTAGYKQLKAQERQRLTSSFANLILSVCNTGRGVLHNDSTRLQLQSLVPGKNYFAFEKIHITGQHRETALVSRPVNSDLYIENEANFQAAAVSFIEGSYATLGAHETTRLLYTLAMSFCAANDVLTKGDKKTPATFFELFISHLLARQIGVLPTKKVRVPAAENVMVDLPTDLIFDAGNGAAKFHVPVKLSTRERVIQAWAHQKVIDGLWGTTEFSGLLVVLTETKLDLSSREVVEICLPNQWRIYQRYIATMKRVYYLDLPPAYAVLATSNPRIDVKQFGEFFFETNALLQR